jgi:hypothetical protein
MGTEEAETAPPPAAFFFDLFVLAIFAASLLIPVLWHFLCVNKRPSGPGRKRI